MYDPLHVIVECPHCGEDVPFSALHPDWTCPFCHTETRTCVRCGQAYITTEADGGQFCYGCDHDDTLIDQMYEAWMLKQECDEAYKSLSDRVMERATRFE